MSASLSGRRVGSYDIGPLVGAGGMGEVYRARDAKLNRDVAIKVLLPSVAGDADRLARFEREAQVLASLNHPNIAHIYGVEQGPEGPLLVLEYVDGPTLADRIASGPLPVDDAIAIARQVADALECAHERGVIHRDLKPANIKVADDGNVKVLDFGLAKAVEHGSGIGDQGAGHNSPTITTPAMTGVGMILGTAAYMSPEQAKGRSLDKRSDVWAFGCVLYEMLTGRRVFDGEDVTDTIAAVVRAEPEWNALPGDTPPQVRLLLKRCLEKDRRARVSDIGIARFLMNETITPMVAVGAPRAAAPRRSLIGAAIVGGAVGAALIALVAWMSRVPPDAAKITRFDIVPTAAQALAIQNSDRDLAISADGSRIAFRGGGQSLAAAQLFVRTLDEVVARPIAGTLGARNPFFSPDGNWIAYFANSELRKVAVSGGVPIALCQIDSNGRGGSWVDDTIVFATSGSGLQRVSAGGGKPELLNADDLTGGNRAPFLLPGGGAVLFTSGVRAASQVEALDFRTHQRKVIVRGASDGVYLKSGYLVFAVVTDPGSTNPTGSLRAARFDVANLTLLSEPVPVLEDVLVLASGIAEYSVSPVGTLVFVPRSASTSAPSSAQSLVWVSRQGVERPLGAPDRVYGTARISPDGTRIAVDIHDQTRDIWIWDPRRATLTPLNRDPGDDLSPQWTPDGRRIVWASTRASSVPNLYWQAADGSGNATRLTISPTPQFPTSVTPDAAEILFFGSGLRATGTDLFALPFASPDGKPRILVRTPAEEFDAEVSPNGRWIAYHSAESGQSQVYVRPYPNVDSGRVQISTTGGTRPAWARNGKELFYLDENDLLNSAAVSMAGDTFTSDKPKRILNTRYSPGSTLLGFDLRGYDVSADGQQFLMIKTARNADQPPSAGAPKMVVVLNWFEDLKQRLPRK